jgi:hypothetical protein
VEDGAWVGELGELFLGCEEGCLKYTYEDYTVWDLYDYGGFV